MRTLAADNPGEISLLSRSEGVSSLAARYPGQPRSDLYQALRHTRIHGRPPAPVSRRIPQAGPRALSRYLAIGMGRMILQTTV